MSRSFSKPPQASTTPPLARMAFSAPALSTFTPSTALVCASCTSSMAGLSNHTSTLSA